MESVKKAFYKKLETDYQEQTNNTQLWLCTKGDRLNQPTLEPR